MTTPTAQQLKDRGHIKPCPEDIPLYLLDDEEVIKGKFTGLTMVDEDGYSLHSKRLPWMLIV